jgi:RNA recognition motif-containing protein
MGELLESKDLTSNEGKEPEVIEKLAGLLSFFFSDTNLRSDTFMKKEMKFNDGMVAIQKLLRFNSIKKITADQEKIVQAVETSELLKPILMLNKDKTSIGRINKFDINNIKDNIPLTLFVKGLPTSNVEISEDGKELPPKSYAVQVDEVKQLFLEYGEIALVRLRYKKKLKKSDPTIAKGEAFIEYESEEMAQKAAADLCKVGDAEPKKRLTIKGNELFVQPMKEWLELKEKEEGEEKSDKRKRKSSAEDEGKEAADDEFDIVWNPGCVISVKGFPDNCDREAIREAMKDYVPSDPKELYLDFSRGQKSGALRFETPTDKIKELAEKLNSGEIEIIGCKVESAHVLEGEEEKTYWDNFKEFKRKQRKQQTASNSRGRAKRGRHSRK